MRRGNIADDGSGSYNGIGEPSQQKRPQGLQTCFALLCGSQRPKLQLYFVICNGYLAVGHDVFYDSDDEKTTCLLLFSLEEIISYRWGSGRSNEKVTFFVVHKLIEYADGINTAHNLKKRKKHWQTWKALKIQNKSEFC